MPVSWWESSPCYESSNEFDLVARLHSDYKHVAIDNFSDAYGNGCLLSLNLIYMINVSAKTQNPVTIPRWWQRSSHKGQYNCDYCIFGYFASGSNDEYGESDPSIAGYNRGFHDFGLVYCLNLENDRILHLVLDKIAKLASY